MPRGCRKAQATRNAALSCVYPRCRWTCKMWAYAGLPFWRLSNRALAAIGGKCRCGSPSRRTRKEQTPARFRAKAAAHREIRRFHISDGLERAGQRRKEIQKPSVFGGVLSPISFAAERNGAVGDNSRRSAEYPLLSEATAHTAKLPSVQIRRDGVYYPQIAN